MQRKNCKFLNLYGLSIEAIWLSQHKFLIKKWTCAVMCFACDVTTVMFILRATDSFVAYILSLSARAKQGQI